jgi:RNA polymerase sigma-70 factor, ECF subfamily
VADDDLTDPRLEAERVARESYGRLLAFLARRAHDVAAAEDALADAFAAALVHWPVTGIPRVPEAWLLVTARRRLSDETRRRRVRERDRDRLLRAAEEAAARCAGGETIPDERLQLMFACAHPALDAAVRAPLILQAVLGLDAGAIASAFLCAPSAMSQRLVRAKRKIRDAAIPFTVPDADDLAPRLDAVLDAIYVAYGEAHLTDEAVHLGRVVVALLPDAPETLGLLALMLHLQARRHARRGRDGSYIPLTEQDPERWDGRLIAEAERLLHCASAAHRPGRFQLEAAVQSVHAARRETGSTDWPAILGLYDELLRLTGSVVVAINRAVAVAGVEGPRPALAALDRVAADQRLVDYQPYWAARADILARLGRCDAAQAYERALGLTTDDAIRRFLAERSAAVRSRPAPVDRS